MPPGVNYSEGDAATHNGPHSRSSTSSTRRRNPMACLLCRKRKIKCEFNNEPDVCDHCRSKNTKCTVLSVAQEEALKTWGYTDESLTLMSGAELESLQRRLPQQLSSSAEHTEPHFPARLLHNSAEHNEPHLTARLPHNNHGPPSSPHHSLPSTGQDRSRAYDSTNWAPSPYNNSAHNHHTANRASSTNSAAVPINIPQPHVHAHHQSPIYQNYPVYTSPSPVHPGPYQIPSTSGASASHHTMGDHHQVQQVHPNIPAHSNVVQSQDHANYSGQTTYLFQPAQQTSQGQTAQYQCGGVYPAMSPSYTHDGSQWRH